MPAGKAGDCDDGLAGGGADDCAKASMPAQAKASDKTSIDQRTGIGRRMRPQNEI
jgi:hypothetical protein